MPEAEEEVPGATDELVAALAGGAALSFEPGRRRRRPPARRPRRPRRGRRRRAARRGVARGDRRRARPRSGREGRRRRRGRLTQPATEPSTAARPAGTITTHTRTAVRPGRRETGERTGMADISAELVKELRERTGAGFMDCKRALTETDGDLDKAVVRPAREGPRRGGEEGRPRRPRGPRLELHPHRRPRRRPHRGQLRDGLRGAHGRVPEARPRPRRPGRRARPAVRRRRPHPGRRTSRRSRPSCSPTRRSRRSPRTSGRRSSRASSRSGTRRSACYDQPFRDEERTVRDLITEKIATIGENIRVRRFTRYALGEEL